VRKRTTFTTRATGARPNFAKGVAMSTVRRKRLPFLAAVAALGILWVAPSALAQSSPAPSSVLPTGGGQGLIDPSDSVMLLLDHQSARP
jgi:hypothetical protein